jgi:hypothetical protein
MGRKLLYAAAPLLALAIGAGAAQAQPSAQQQRQIAALQTRIAKAAADVVRLEDVAQIRRLQNTYGYYLDRGLWDEAAGLFARDATIEFGNEGVYVGQDRIRQYFRRLGGGGEGLARGQLNSQYFIMPVITLAKDGKTAMARWKDIAMKGQFGKAAYWGDGAYENTYAKEDGVWKIKALHRFTTYVAPYEKGWSASDGKPDISVAAQGFPADRPPTFTYDPFPGVFIPAYHPQTYARADDPLLKGVAVPASTPVQPKLSAAPSTPAEAAAAAAAKGATQ